MSSDDLASALHRAEVSLQRDSEEKRRRLQTAQLKKCKRKTRLIRRNLRRGRIS